MRQTQKVSVWPVAFVNNSIYHGPICKGNQVKEWFTYSDSYKSYLIDSSQFCFSINLLKRNPKIMLNLDSTRPYDAFVSAMAQKSELEPRADQCSKVHNL